MSSMTPALDRRGLTAVVLGHLAVFAALLVSRPDTIDDAEAAPMMATLILPAEPQPEVIPPPLAPVQKKIEPVKPQLVQPPVPETPPIMAKPEIAPTPSPVVVAPPPPPAPPVVVDKPVPAPEPIPAPQPVAAPPVVERVAEAPAPVRPVAPMVDADDKRRYLAALISHLDRHKTYPAALKKARIEGNVVVEFTIDKFGRITSSGIRKGSGQPELDRAALSMLSRANPLPPIPAALKLDSLEMTRNIEYSLITNR